MFFEAFRVFGITGSATIKQVQTKPFAFILRILFEDNCGSQHAFDGRIFKFVET